MQKIKVFIKKILLKISPVYRTVNNNRIQLENMQNALMNMEDNNRIRLENMQNALNERENSNQMQFENMKKMLSQIDQNNRMNDESYLHPDVPKLDKLSNWLGYLVEIGNKRGMKILEVGSRVVTGQNFRGHFAEAKYVGFDFYAGDNVDVVGDAHKLSSYFEKDEKFDIIFSAAVFEHFAMPWIVAKEMAKLLKVGGHVFVATHFSYSSHERPWHFFQFSDMALKVLFPSAMGFECIEVGMALPIVGRFSSLIEGELKNKPITGLYASVHFLGKKIKEVENFEYEKIDLADVVGETKYPEPNLLHGFQ